MRCRECGADDLEGDKFCATCGTPLERQRWEYCAIVGMRRTSRQLDPAWPAIWYFTPDGLQVTKIDIDERHEVTQAIANLGKDGWEAVGSFPANELEGVQSYGLLFKRPILQRKR